MAHNSPAPVYIRNFVFGVEDSLVSTVGLLSGVAVAGVVNKTIVLTGVVLIFVEAFSMAVGSLLSEDTVDEAIKDKEAEKKSLSGSLVMFFSYFISGFIPLLPYMFNLGDKTLCVSIGSTLVALILLGLSSAKYLHISMLKSGTRMLLLGGSAIAIGVLVGQFATI